MLNKFVFKDLTESNFLVIRGTLFQRTASFSLTLIIRADRIKASILLCCVLLITKCSLR